MGTLVRLMTICLRVTSLQLNLWDDLLQDDSFFELAIDNLSLSQLEISLNVSHEQSGNFKVPMAALDALQNYCFPSE